MDYLSWAADASTPAPDAFAMLGAGFESAGPSGHMLTPPVRAWLRNGG
jgi:hypothetical protein